MRRDIQLDLTRVTHNRDVGQCTMTVLDAIQRFPREVQLLAVAGLFLLLLRHWGERASTTLNFVDNIMFSDGTLPEFKAAEAYIQGEL